MPPSDSVVTTPLLCDGYGVCAALGIKWSKFHSMKRSGRFPIQPIRLGRSVRFRVRDVEAWVAAGCPNSDKWQAMRFMKGVA